MKIPNAKARATDPTTSQWAAETVRTRRQMCHLLKTLTDLEYQFDDEPGYTDVRIYSYNTYTNHYKDTAQGLRSRRADAVKLGLIEMADREGISPTGRACKRWKLTKKGMAVARQIIREANNE